MWYSKGLEGLVDIAAKLGGYEVSGPVLLTVVETSTRIQSC